MTTPAAGRALLDVDPAGQQRSYRYCYRAAPALFPSGVESFVVSARARVTKLESAGAGSGEILATCSVQLLDTESHSHP